MVKQRKRKGKMFITKGVKINKKNNNNENFGFEPKNLAFSAHCYKFSRECEEKEKETCG